MTRVLAPVFGLSLLDSLNPSAVAVTLYLLLSRGAFVPRVLSYATGIFAANLVLGSVLMLGLGSVRGLFDGPAAYGTQGVTGAALLGYAVLAPNGPQGERKGRKPRSLGPGAVFLLGMTITVVEFSTALPYLGAVAILTNAGLTFAQWLPVLAAYNLVFVAPPLLLLGAYRTFGARLRPTFERWGERLQSAGRGTPPWILGIAGLLLLADSLRYFDFFGLV